MYEYSINFIELQFNVLCQVNASDVIILEGILVFHDLRVGNLMNMKNFVATGLIPPLRLLLMYYPIKLSIWVAILLL